jgi:thiol:disulfide interchange protein DsbC
MKSLSSTTGRRLQQGAVVLALAGAALSSALADEAAIRKNLAERMPGLPKIDEVSKTPIPGLYEVRIGTDILYTDERPTTSSRARSTTPAPTPT